LPFSLVPSLFVMGSYTWIPLLNNLVLFCATVLITYRLATVVSNERVARVATLLLVLWPNFTFYAGLPATELLTAFLLPLAILIYFESVTLSDGISRLRFAFLAGLILGFSSLTQASFLLFPSIFVLYELVAGNSFSKAYSRMALLILGMLLVVSPWTLRNYFVLNAFVPISTNGGWSLYIGNNPSASGGHVPAEADFQGYDEVTANKKALARGAKWIIDNPKNFIGLAVRKQIMFLGDDSTGVFWTLKRGLGIGDIRYAALKGWANLFWLGLSILLLVSFISQWKSPLSESPEILVLILSVFYFLSLHSVFESGSRHHVALAGCLTILAALTTRTAISGRRIRATDEERP